MIAALYVLARGPYSTLPNVDLWDEKRDARLYMGPWPVVAHPPCQRWGCYWSGGPSAAARAKRGDDAGCFAAALTAVRIWGGVLEHPARSSAWRAFRLDEPRIDGGWSPADHFGGWTCHIEQGHYGHRARKATWLYARKVRLPMLRWGPSALASTLSPEELRIVMRTPKGLSGDARAARRALMDRYARETGKALAVPEQMNKRERLETPPPFAQLLARIAASAVRDEE